MVGREDHIFPFERGRDRQDHIAEQRCGGQEKIMRDGQIDLFKRADVFLDVASLI